MQRSGNGPSVGWAYGSIPFDTAPGIGWRLHMSQIASESRQFAHRYAAGMVKHHESIVYSTAEVIV
jgi:hypothetical protein